MSDPIQNGITIYLPSIFPTKNASVYEETKEILSIIETNLALLNSSKKNIIHMTVYLDNNIHYNEVISTINKWLDNSCNPVKFFIHNVHFSNLLCKVHMSVLAEKINPYKDVVYQELNYIR